MRTLNIAVILQADEKGNDLIFKSEIDMELVKMYISGEKNDSQRIHQAPPLFLIQELAPGIECMLHSAMQSEIPSTVKHMAFLRRNKE